jgi:imidazolonepropionase-like amidohydrolase
MHRTCLLPLVAALCASTPALAGEVTALVGATVVDATGGPSIVDATVLIDGERITAVGPRDSVDVPDGATVIDVAGRWITPGLVDPHMHFFQSGGLYTRPDIIDLRAVRSYESETEGIRRRMQGTFDRYLASGVTAIVDMGGPMWNLDVRQEAGEAELAPHVAVAGPLISTVARPQLDLGDPPIIRVDSAKAARALVRQQLKADVDLIKIWFILPPSGDVAENLDIIQATITAAHKGKARVAVHATELETARAAVQAGADILVHSVVDQPVDDAFVQLLLERDVIYTTTLVVFEGYAEVLGGSPDLTDIEARLGDPEVIASWGELEAATGGAPEGIEARRERLAKLMPIARDNLNRMLEAGVVVAAGTDAGNIGTLHGPSMHREFELMAEAGATPAQVLIAATRDAARIFAPSPDFGTVEAGKLADLLILDADPLTDVRNLRRIEGVVLGGRLLDPATVVPANPASVVQGQLDAYNARELEGFLNFYAEDVVVERQDGTTIAEGREAMRPIYAGLFEASPDLHCHLLSRTVSGSMVVDHELVTGMRGGPPVRAAAIYEVTGGLIRRVTFGPKEP